MVRTRILSGPPGTVCGLHGGYLTDDRRYVGITVKQTLTLVPDGPCRPAPAQLPLSGDQADDGGPFQASDFRPPLPGTDILLRATCHVPDREPVESCVAGFRLGPVERGVLVSGDRWWVDGAISGPEPFLSRPLTWAEAFGGPDFADNPWGKGHMTTEAVEAPVPLPTVEAQGAWWTEPGCVITPIGLGPLDWTWPARRHWLGEIGEDWRPLWSPWPPGTDPRIHRAAPEWQQSDSPLRGDESFILLNLHPRHARLDGALPGTTAIGRVRRAPGAPLEELPLVLDSVWFDPDHDRVVLAWHGALMVDSLTAPPFHAAEVLLVPLDVPGPSPRVWESRLAALEPPPAPAPAEDAHATTLRPPDPLADPELRPDLDKLLVLTEGLLAQATGDSLLAMKAVTLLRGAASLDQLMAGIDRLIRDLVLGDIDPDALAEDLATRNRAGLADQFHEAGLDPQVADRLAGAMTEPESGPAPEAQPAWTAETLHRHHLQGGSLAGLVLDGLELSGRDWSGMDFQGAFLRGARLAGCTLSHARLTDADLTGADLTGADLTEALLDRAVFTDAVLDRARLTGAQAVGAVFLRARLTDADLTGLVAPWARFQEARLVRPVLVDADLAHGIWDRVVIDGGDLTGAGLAGLQLNEARLTACGLRGADLAGAVLSGARLADCDLFQCRAPGLVCDQAHLSGCRLAFADLTDVFGAGGVWAGIDARAACLRRGILTGARLDRVDLSRADLFQARLDQAGLDDLDLTDANIHSVGVFDCRLGDGDDLARLLGEAPT